MPAPALLVGSDRDFQRPRPAAFRARRGANRVDQQLLRTQFDELIDQKNWRALRAALAGEPVPHLVDLMFELDKTRRVVVFRLLPRPVASEVFAYLEPDIQTALLKDATDEETRHLLNALEPDDRVHLLEELPGAATQRLLNLLGPEDLREARQLLGYPEDSIGRLMTPEYVAVRPDWTIARALDHIRRRGTEGRPIGTIYVVDARWWLLDALDLQRFILADPDRTVEAIMDRVFVSVTATEDRERAIETIRRHDLSALPVVDSDGILVGVVAIDDVLDVAQEEATEDFHRAGAVAPLRASYRDATLRSLYLRRVPWLLVLVFVNIISGAGIAFFEDTIAAVVSLVFFLPVLIGSAGNAGSQASTLMVRAMATGDVRPGDWARLMGKELLIAGTLGLTMGLAVSLIGVVRAGPDVALVVAITMVVVVIVGSLIGLSLPFLLGRLNLDPATASAPLVTSLADISGVLIYFSLATWLLEV